MMRGFRKRRRSTRFGTTAVETALVLPVFLMFVLGMVELGRAVFVQHVLNGACRKAARLGSTDGNTTAAVKAKTLEILGSAVKSTAVTVYVKDASSFDTASPARPGRRWKGWRISNSRQRTRGKLFMVRAKVKYERHRDRETYSDHRIFSAKRDIGRTSVHAARVNGRPLWSSTYENYEPKTSSQRRCCGRVCDRGAGSVGDHVRHDPVRQGI